MKKFLALGLSIVVFLVFAQPAFPEEQADPQDAGYPVRVAAYILHPVGWALYHGIFKPAHAFVSSPGVRDIFGYEEDIFTKSAWEQGATQVCPTPPQKPEAKPMPEEAPAPSEKAPELKAPQPPAESPPPQIEQQPSPQQQPEQSMQVEPQSKTMNRFQDHADFIRSDS